MTRRRLLSLLGLWLFAAIAPALAAPIPLAKPLDLRGKRVLVVSVFGQTAAVHAFAGGLMGRYELGRTNHGAYTLDDAARKAAVDRLVELGVDAQPLPYVYDDVALYGDPDGFGNTGATRESYIDRVAGTLMAAHKPDALLILSRGAGGMAGYKKNPPYGYGLFIIKEGAAAFVGVEARLYRPERDSHEVMRMASTRAPAGGDIRATDDLSPPPIEEWRRLQPVFEEQTLRVVRTITAETFDRAARPRKDVQERWRSTFKPEQGVTTIGN